MIGDALSSVPAAMVLHNRAPEALALARTLPVGSYRITALLSIARAQRDRGNMADAAATASEVNAQIELTPSDMRDYYYGLRAEFQARAESYGFTDYRDALVSALDSLADEKAAMRSESDKALPRPTIVEVADAVALAHAISYRRLDTLAEIATPLLLSGDRRALEIPIREALATVNETRASDSDYDWNEELTFIAVTQVAARDYAGAKATARLLTQPSSRLGTLAIVAWGEACTDEMDVAKKTLADALADARQADRQKDVLGVIAVVQARLGDREQALTTAEGIPAAGRRVDALIGIATGRLSPLWH